ncbi:MAG: c-type cytochrome [Bacteroidia bacterium]|nr:c-type cytochrome [Bacteroidia bacterium]
MKTYFKNNRIYKGLRPVGLGALLLLAAMPAMAQDASQNLLIGEEFITQLRILMVLMVVIILLLGVITLFVTVKDPSKISWAALMAHFAGTDAKDPLMDHRYDGIEELDNPIPAWLAAIFYGTVGFGVIYLLVFHIFKWGPMQDEEYTREVALAEMTYKDVELPDDALVLLEDESSIEAGHAIWTANCMACHGALGEGGIGPNMTDDYWLHGNTIKDIYRTITNGVPEKGMISWKEELSSNQRLQVASFIKSLHGTNPPNPKEPQGSLMTGEGGSENAISESNVTSDTTKHADSLDIK